jgi:hypothetical protein
MGKVAEANWPAGLHRGFILAGAVFRRLCGQAGPPAFLAAGLIVGLDDLVVQLHLLKPFLPFPRLQARAIPRLENLASRFPAPSMTASDRDISWCRQDHGGEAVFYSWGG